MSPTVAAQLDAVRARIEAAARGAGRDPASVTLVAATKTVEPARIAEALTHGLRDVGENRAQELLAKAPELARLEPVWHFLGPVQRNKVKALAPLVACWHSLDRPALADAIAAYAPGARVLVEVNVGEEPQKAGCAPAATGALVDHARAAGLDVAGLMTVPPAQEDPRPYFAALRGLGATLRLPELSMGMTDDFELAIAEGATIVRVGRAIFGARPRRD